MKKFTDDPLVLALHKTGHDCTQIAARLNLCRQTVSMVLRRNRVRVLKKWERAVDGVDFKAVVKEYMAGGSTLAVGRKHGICHHTVCDAVRKAGNETRRSHTYYQVNHNAFDLITPESAYWAGFLMADGCIYNGQKTPQIRLEISTVDLKHIKNFRQFIGGDMPIRHRTLESKITGKIYSYSSLAFNSEKIAYKLANFGIVANKTSNAKAKLLEDSVDFWRGVIDGDGCLSWNGKYPQIRLTGSRYLLQQFSDFIFVRIGFRLTVGKYHPTTYSVGAKGEKAIEVIRLLYDHSVIHLKRKKKIADRMLMQQLQSHQVSVKA